jgi:hypothetical protein
VGDDEHELKVLVGVQRDYAGLERRFIITRRQWPPWKLHRQRRSRINWVAFIVFSFCAHEEEEPETSMGAGGREGVLMR